MTESMPAPRDRLVETPSGPLFVREITGDDRQCQ